MRKIKILLVFLFWVSALAGCVTAPKLSAPVLPTKAAPAVAYHKVAKGQTIWRIARLYGMEAEELANLNGIPDSAKLEVGRVLVIPADRKIQLSSPDTGEEDFVWPLRGKIISGFNQQSNGFVNKGINIAPSRSGEVFASRSGKVAFYNDNFLDLGKTIIVEHPGGFWTVYGRNQEVFVKPGDIVSRGTAIARAGAAGSDSNVYLHFEIRKGSKSENPLFYLP